MTGFGLAAAVLTASLVSTYVFCLRPMRRGHCAMFPSRGGGQHSAKVQERDAEASRLREQIAAVDAEHTPTSPAVADGASWETAERIGAGWSPRH